MQRKITIHAVNDREKPASTIVELSGDPEKAVKYLETALKAFVSLPHLMDEVRAHLDYNSDAEMQAAYNELEDIMSEVKPCTMTVQDEAAAPAPR